MNKKKFKKFNKILSIILTICVLTASSDVSVFAAENTHMKGEEIDIVMPVVDEMVEIVELEEVDVMDVVEEPELEPEKPKNESLGKFKITYYCACKKCSGKWGDMTATGVRAKEGRTIAVDPKVIPYGTKVIIDGHEYIAEDCGGAIKGNKIDIYVGDHNRALKKGVDYFDVYVKR